MLAEPVELGVKAILSLTVDRLVVEVAVEVKVTGGLVGLAVDELAFASCGWFLIISEAGLGGGDPMMVLLTMLANGRIICPPLPPGGCFFCLGAFGRKRTGSRVDWIMLAIGVLLAEERGQQTAGIIRFLRHTDCFSRALSRTSQMHFRISLHSPS